MRTVNDIAGLQQPPFLDAGEARSEISARAALYPLSALFQPALLKADPNAPAPVYTGATMAEPADPFADAPVTLPDLFNMPFLIQQGSDGGATGTATLAEIMSYLGVPMTQADIDKEIRRTGVGLAPEDMIDFAREHGFTAEGYNNGSWDELKSMIDAGHPVQAMLNNGDFLNITGHGTDPATGEEYVVYRDNKQGTDQRMSLSDFEKKWGPANDGLIHLDGFNHYFIAYGQKGDDLPPGRDNGIEGTLGYENGVANLANGLDRIIHPDNWGGLIHGIFETVGGIPQTIGCYFASALQAGGNWLNNEVNGIPVLQNIVQPFGDLVSGIGAGLADLCNGVGECFDDFGGAIEDLSHGNWGAFADRIGDTVVDLGSGVVDAAEDVIGSVGDAVGDIFSGW